MNFLYFFHFRFAPTDVQGPFKICLPAFDEPDQAQKLATDVVVSKLWPWRGKLKNEGG